MQDKVIHYIIEKTYYANTWNDTIKVLNKDTTFTEKDYWLDAVFTFKPKPFPIKFAIDYRGRGGEYYYYFVDYNKNEESFKEIIDSRYKEGDENIPSSWIPMVH